MRKTIPMLKCEVEQLGASLLTWESHDFQFLLFLSILWPGRKRHMHRAVYGSRPWSQECVPKGKRSKPHDSSNTHSRYCTDKPNCWLVFVSTWHKVVSSGKKESWLEKIPPIVLIEDGGEGPSSLCGAACGLVVLGAVRKQAEESMRSKPVNSSALWSLHQLLSWIPALTFLDDELAVR